MQFQSLLSWISLLGHERHPGFCRIIPVSILVVLDQSARQWSMQSNVELVPVFQSLLSWISLLGKQHRRVVKVGH